ncbi:MAG: NifU family protein [Myxococcales bacterium]|nr:NifU family protein [Myxococcales bacterium]
MLRKALGKLLQSGIENSIVDKMLNVAFGRRSASATEQQAVRRPVESRTVPVGWPAVTLPVTEEPPIPEGLLQPLPLQKLQGQGPTPPRTSMPAPPRRLRVRFDAPAPKADPHDVGIVAQATPDNRQCAFMLERPVLTGLSWRFVDAAAASASPFARALFEQPEVAWVQVHHDLVTIARRSGKDGDWLPLAESLGARIRAAMGAGLPVLTEEQRAVIPTPSVLRTTIEGIIEAEVNPGLAAHSGNVTLRDVRGNALYLEMGGGCQGCSAAALTLKVGIYNAFRAQVPGVGVIYDLTDHTAGTAPYFTEPVADVGAPT